MLIRFPCCNWTFHPFMLCLMSLGHLWFLVSLTGNLLKAAATVGGLQLLKLYVVSPFFPAWQSITQGHITSRILDSVWELYIYSLYFAIWGICFLALGSRIYQDSVMLCVSDLLVTYWDVYLTWKPVTSPVVVVYVHTVLGSAMCLKQRTVS